MAAATCGAPQAVLREGTQHLRGALCQAGDLELFRALQAELQGALGILGRKREGPWTWAGGIEDALSTRSPWRPSIGCEQLLDLESQGKRAHARVLRKLSEAVGAPLEMWWTNLYDDASVGCDFHHDEHKHDAMTASASFGAARDLTFRHCASGSEFSFRLANGDVFAFDATVDAGFQHGLHPDERALGPRISVIAISRAAGGVRGAARRRQGLPGLPAPPRAPRLTRQQALEMEEALARGFRDAAFQRRLHAAWAAAGGDRAGQLRAKQELCLPVQLPVISRYGFEASRRGVLESLHAVRADFLEDREVMEKAAYLSWLVDPGLQAQAQPAA